MSEAEMEAEMQRRVKELETEKDKLASRIDLYHKYESLKMDVSDMTLELERIINKHAGKKSDSEGKGAGAEQPAANQDAQRSVSNGPLGIRRFFKVNPLSYFWKPDWNMKKQQACSRDWHMGTGRTPFLHDRAGTLHYEEAFWELYIAQTEVLKTAPEVLGNSPNRDSTKELHSHHWCF